MAQLASAAGLSRRDRKMRTWAVAGAISVFLCGCASVPHHRQVAADSDSAAEVRRLEDRWTTAFNDRDTRFMDRVLAPEFVLLASGRAQGANFTRRYDWMRVWLGPKRLPYKAKVLDVVIAGDAAVATLEASWSRDSYLTDTWARRNGRWQLIFRHSVPRN